MSLFLAVRGGEISLDEIPGDFGSDSAPAHAEHVHVVILHALLRREVVVDERGADARDLVDADRRADAASADGNASFDRPRTRLRERAGSRSPDSRRAGRGYGLRNRRPHAPPNAGAPPVPPSSRSRRDRSRFPRASCHLLIEGISSDPAAARSARMRARS